MKFQNALMHISKPRAYPIFITLAIKVYELKGGLLGPIRQYYLPHNPILKLIQYPIVEN